MPTCSALYSRRLGAPPSLSNSSSPCACSSNNHRHGRGARVAGPRRSDFREPINLERQSNKVGRGSAGPLRFGDSADAPCALLAETLRALMAEASEAAEEVMVRNLELLCGLSHRLTKVSHGSSKPFLQLQGAGRLGASFRTVDDHLQVGDARRGGMGKHS